MYTTSEALPWLLGFGCIICRCSSGCWTACLSTPWATASGSLTRSRTRRSCPSTPSRTRTEGSASRWSPLSRSCSDSSSTPAWSLHSREVERDNHLTDSRGRKIFFGRLQHFCQVRFAVAEHESLSHGEFSSEVLFPPYGFQLFFSHTYINTVYTVT